MSETAEQQPEVTLEAIKPIANPFEDSAEGNGKREINLMAEADGRKALYLRLIDDTHGSYSPLLGFTKTYKRDDLAEKLDNFIVPIMLRCYTTPNRHPALAANPRKGWIYIIRQRPGKNGGTICELWRELKSDGNGSYSDVNLTAIKELKKQKKAGESVNLDQRKATGQPGFRIIVPYQVDNTPHDLWIAFSEVQWSWERIEQLRTDPQLREKRMHKLDLSDCLNHFDKSKYSLLKSAINWWGSWGDEIYDYKDVTGTATLYNAETAPDKISEQLPDKFKEKIPVIYLDDPVGIGRELAANYQKECGRMLHIVARQQDAETKALDIEEDVPVRWLKSAILLNKHITKKIENSVTSEILRNARREKTKSYNKYWVLPPATTKQEWEKQQQLCEEYLAQKEAFDNLVKKDKSYDDYVESIKDIRSAIDDERFHEALATPEREKIRKDMLTAKKYLVQYLEKELRSQTETPLVIALDDHFSLAVNRDWSNFSYPQPNEGQHRDKSQLLWPNIKADGWRTVGSLLGWISKSEYNFDEEFHNHRKAWDEKKEDSALKLLRDLADPECHLALHTRIFPAAATSDPLKPETQDGKSPARFQVGQYAPEKTENNSIQTLLENDRDEGLGLFLTNYEELGFNWDREDKDYTNAINRCHDSLIRLVSDQTGIGLKKVSCPVEDFSELKRQFKQQKDYFGLAKASTVLGVKITNKPIDTLAPKYQAMLKDVIFEATFDTETNIENSKVKVEGTTAQIKEVRLVQNNKKYHNDLKDHNKTVVHGTESTLDVHGNTTKVTIEDSSHVPDGHKHYTRAHIIIGEDEAAKMRYAERLNTMEGTRITGLGILGIFEMISTRNAWIALENCPDESQRTKLLIDFIGNALGLAEAAGNFAKPAASAVFGTDALERFASSRYAVFASETFNIFGKLSGYITIGMTVNSMLENIVQGDDAANSYGVITAGLLLSMAPESLLVSGATSLLGVGPVAAGTVAVAVPLAIVAVGFVLLATVYSESTNIELWVENGPYADDKFPNRLKYLGAVPAVANYLFSHERFGGYQLGDELPPKRDKRPKEDFDQTIDKHPSILDPGGDAWAGAKKGISYLWGMLNQHTHNSHRYAVWGKTPDEAYHALFDAMFRPSMTITNSRVDSNGQLVVAEVFVPKQLETSKLICEIVEITSAGKRTTCYEQNYIDNGSCLSRKSLDEWDRVNKHCYRLTMHFHEDVVIQLNVRLSLYGDEQVVLPYEECYQGTTTELANGTRWLSLSRKCLIS